MDNLWSFWSALGYCVFIQTFKRSWVRWCSCGLCLFSWSLCLWFGHSPLRVLFACLRLHWLHMSPATQVESGIRRDLDKGKTKNLPQGFRSLRWSRASSACLIKGVFTQRRQPRTRDVSPRSHRFIILLFTTILSEEYTSTQRRAWQADHVHVIRGYRSRHGAAIAWSLLTN